MNLAIHTESAIQTVFFGGAGQGTVSEIESKLTPLGLFLGMTGGEYLSD